MKNNARIRLIKAISAVVVCSVMLLNSAACASAATGLKEPSSSNLVETDNAKPDFNLNRGINLAGDFEVEPRGAWGSPIDENAFMRIAKAGFDHVRVPIRWSSYTGAAPSFNIRESFFSEVDRLVELAKQSALSIVINVHFFEELEANPSAERDRFLAIWDQIARRYQDEPHSVIFELMNEPIGEFTNNPQLWNKLAADALAVIRRSNPKRLVIIGPVQYNHPSRLPDLVLPNDNYLIATIHSYDPTQFTHQGAIFVDPIPPTGVLWQPNTASINLNWQDWSWDADITGTASGLKVKYLRQYAAIAMHNDIAQTYQQLTIKTNSSLDAIVLCNFHTPAAIAAPITFNGNQGVATLTPCGSINSLAIQLLSAESLATVITQLSVCNDSCEELVVTQYEAMNNQLSEAANWAAKQSIPLYLGEFGAINPIGDPTDKQSRTDWTRSMRTIAESYGIGWAYFAHDGEFGAYDRETDKWIPAVLDALIE